MMLSPARSATPQGRWTRRRTLVGGVWGGAAAFVAACGGTKGATEASKTVATPTVGSSSAQTATERPEPGGTLNIFQVGNPPTLDPHRTTSFYTENVAGAVLSRLLRFKAGADPKVTENKEVTSDLADSVESPDALTWTVKLRPNARFHAIAPVNGHAVEAEDIVSTFTRAVANENPGRDGLTMIDPAQIQAPAKDTVVFKLKFPYAPFRATLASPTYGWVLPREAAGGYDPQKQMIGSGPFILDTVTPDVAVLAKKNPDWFESGRPLVDAVRRAIIPDAAQQRAQFTAGNLDTIDTTANDLEQLKRDNPKATVVTSSPSAGQVLFFQLGDPNSPFQDIRVRRAFSLALDREALSKAVYQGQAEPQWYVYLSMGKWSLRQKDLDAATAQWYAYDPAASKRLLAEAGMADKQFKLVVVTGYLGIDYETAGSAIANMLQTAGIKATLTQVDYTKDFIAGGKGIRYGNYDSDMVVFAGISGYTEVDQFIFNYYHSNGTSQLSRLKDAELDGRIDKARGTVNEDDRVKAYIDIQRYLAEKLYTVAGMAQPYRYYFVQSRVRDYQHSTTYGAGSEAYANLWLKRS